MPLLSNRRVRRGVIRAVTSAYTGKYLTAAVSGQVFDDPAFFKAGRPGCSSPSARPPAASENALAAFTHAAAMGADVLEMDVQASADGAIVCALVIPDRLRGEPLPTQRLIEAAHRRKLSVHVWTINDGERMSELLQAKVDGLITDRPDILLRLLRRRE